MENLIINGGRGIVNNEKSLNASNAEDEIYDKKAPENHEHD